MTQIHVSIRNKYWYSTSQVCNWKKLQGSFVNFENLSEPRLEIKNMFYVQNNFGGHWHP